MTVANGGNWDNLVWTSVTATMGFDLAQNIHPVALVLNLQTTLRCGSVKFISLHQDVEMYL